MPDDDAFFHGIELVFLTEPRSQEFQRIQLRGFNLGDVEIPRDANPDRIFIVMQGVRPNRSRSTPLFNRAVLANHVMIADARPAVYFLMKFVNLLRRRIFVAVGKARVMYHNHFGRRAQLVLGELQK